VVRRVSARRSHRPRQVNARTRFFCVAHAQAAPRQVRNSEACREGHSQ
jgi:hypothetical protein